MEVAEISGQFGHMHLHIYVGAIPPEQSLDGKAMPLIPSSE
jgi:hypothetical protein